MKEERMKILELIEKGVISAKEGVELLDVLKGSESTKEKFDKAVKMTGEFASATKDKICEFAKEKEPIVKETVENIANVAGGIAEGFAEGVNNAIKSVMNNEKSDIIDPEDLDDIDVANTDEDADKDIDEEDIDEI